MAQALIPHGDPADYTQAIMDFGAIQCTPAAPRCAGCRGRCGRWPFGLVAAPAGRPGGRAAMSAAMRPDTRPPGHHAGVEVDHGRQGQPALPRVQKTPATNKCIKTHYNSFLCCNKSRCFRNFTCPTKWTLRQLSLWKACLIYAVPEQNCHFLLIKTEKLPCIKSSVHTIYSF